MNNFQLNRIFDEIAKMSLEELKQLIQSIVLDTMEEADDLNEIIENLTRE